MWSTVHAQLKTVISRVSPLISLLHIHHSKVGLVTINNNNNNNNKHEDIYSAVIMAEPLREFTRFTR